MAERVGLIIGADTSQFNRQLQSSGREVEKLDRLLGKGRKGLFSEEEAKDYDQQLVKVRRSLGSLSSEYRRVSQEVRRMESEQQRLIASGQKVSTQQKQQLADLKAHQRASGHALASQQQQLKWVEEERAGMVTRGRFGMWAGRTMARYLGPVAMAYGAYRMGGWMRGQMDAGTATLIANQLAMMQSERLIGRDPGSQNWRVIRRGFERYGRTLGYTTAETHAYFQQGARARGRITPVMARQNLAMMRGFAMDPGTLFGYHAAARQAGAITDASNINRAMIQGLRYGGFARALSGEFTRALSGLLAMTAEGRERVNAGRLAGLFGFMGRRLGGAYQQAPQRTAALLAGLHGTITAPGGGEAGQAMMLRAMGFGRGTSYVNALMKMERGITPENVRLMLTQLRKEVPGDMETQMLALSRWSGGRLKLYQAQRLLGLDPSEITDKNIRAAMSRQSADIGGEASKVEGRVGLIRRQIALAEAQAAARAKTDVLYKKIHDAQLSLLELFVEVIRDFERLIKNPPPWIRWLVGMKARTEQEGALPRATPEQMAQFYRWEKGQRRKGR